MGKYFPYTQNYPCLVLGLGFVYFGQMQRKQPPSTLPQVPFLFFIVTPSSWLHGLSLSCQVWKFRWSLRSHYKLMVLTQDVRSSLRLRASFRACSCSLIVSVPGGIKSKQHLCEFLLTEKYLRWPKKLSRGQEPGSAVQTSSWLVRPASQTGPPLWEL